MRRRIKKEPTDYLLSIRQGDVGRRRRRGGLTYHLVLGRSRPGVADDGGRRVDGDGGQAGRSRHGWREGRTVGSRAAPQVIHQMTGR